jgi:hypothetical protein
MIPALVVIENSNWGGMHDEKDIYGTLPNEILCPGVECHCVTTVDELVTR